MTVVQYRTVVHSRWLETPVSILCSRIVRRYVQRVTTSAELLRGPEPTEDCWATVNGTLLGNRESSSTEQLSIHGGRRAAPHNPSARADGNEDAVPIGTNSQGAVTHYGPSDLEAALLHVSEPQWFNLSFAFMHTDELGDRQSLVAASNIDRLYSSPCGRVQKSAVVSSGGDLT